MIRVLIVDDFEVVRRGLREIFTDEFPMLEVGEAAEAQSALELALAKEWDLVLLDINIPGRNGFEVLNELKRNRFTTPVLVLSAYPEEEFALRSFKLGASGYLHKGRASDELLVAAKKILAGGRYITASLAEKLAAAVGRDVAQLSHENLSLRELQVLKLVACGKTIKEVAADLSLSEKTVGTYRTRISKKMGLATNVEIARYALQHQLVD